MMNHQVQAVLEQKFRKTVQKDSKIHNATLLIHSDKLGIHVKLAEGVTEGQPTHPDQPYHIASVSKLFVGVIFAMLVEKGLCSYEDPISMYLDEDLLHQLHVYKGTDYTKDIKIKHLLNHTSGLHDFLEDKPKKAKWFVDQILDDPQRAYTPREVVDWAKQNLDCHFPPGKGFHYSDTGYNLLGWIIEKITNQPYHQVLHSYIFEPLQMKHSYFGHYSTPTKNCELPVSDLYVQNTNIKNYESFTVIYAGGAIVSTTEDLLKFMKALVQGKLISPEMIEKMKQDCGRFFPGIDYGYGMMKIKAVPLFMPKKYEAWGNAGSTGSFLFYHPLTDSYLIGTLNHFGYGPKGIRFMLQMIDKLLKGKQIAPRQEQSIHS